MLFGTLSLLGKKRQHSWLALVFRRWARHRYYFLLTDLFSLLCCSWCSCMWCGGSCVVCASSKMMMECSGWTTKASTGSTTLIFCRLIIRLGKRKSEFSISICCSICSHPFASKGDGITQGRFCGGLRFWFWLFLCKNKSRMWIGRSIRFGFGQTHRFGETGVHVVCPCWLFGSVVDSCGMHLYMPLMMEIH